MKIILLAVALFLLIPATSVFACMCPGYDRGSVENEVKTAVDGSSSVFVGKVIGIEYKKGVLFERQGVKPSTENTGKELETKVVKFQVEQWWKMELPSEILFITDLTREIRKTDELTIAGNIFLLPAGEPLNMCHTHFATDQSYLVYASGDGKKLQYRYCTRTRSIVNAAEDLAVLGVGKLPTAEREN